MIDPLLALLAFGAVAAAVAAVFWPRRGLAARITRLRKLSDRVRLEDALKHLYHCEYAGGRSTEESLAGALETSHAGAVRLLVRLEEMGFVFSDEAGVRLTDEGRGYALRIVRTHRLWERYLADRTGVAPGDWHLEADRQEHTLSPAEAEDLASRLGHPRYDPHGDPIPTASGEVPRPVGMPLTSLELGQLATIVHLEDEPPEVFDEIVAAGLSPAMQVRVLDVSNEEVRFEAEGREHRVRPIVARHITVEPLPADVPADRHETLADLREDETGCVVRITPACQGPQRRRLLDLGVVPGTLVTAELVSTGGDPVAYRIRGALIALRREQASWVRIRRTDTGRRQARRHRSESGRRAGS